jgi:hypothetical protein
MKVTATDGRVFDVDTSDETCKPRGFAHEEIGIDPHDNEVQIMGVAPGNDGVTLVVWYIIDHPATRGRVCYWGGKFPGDLIRSGFRKK